MKLMGRLESAVFKCSGRSLSVECQGAASWRGIVFPADQQQSHATRGLTLAQTRDYPGCALRPDEVGRGGRHGPKTAARSFDGTGGRSRPKADEPMPGNASRVYLEVARE